MLTNDKYYFSNDNLSTLYNKNKILELSEVEAFSKLSKSDYVELFQLSSTFQISDHLTPYLVMNYTTELGRYFNSYLNDDKINQHFLEIWYTYFHNKDWSELNQFYLFVVLFSTDLYSRIENAIDNLEFSNEYQDFIYKYSSLLYSYIDNGEFFNLFGIDYQSTTGLIEKGNDLSDFVINLKYNIEFFYHSYHYLNSSINFLSSRKNKEEHEFHLKYLIELINVSNPELFITSKNIKKIKKLKEDEENDSVISEEYQDIESNDKNAVYTPKNIFRPIYALFKSKPLKNKENGAIQCLDGEFRKPFSKEEIFIINSHSKNWVFLTFAFSLFFFTMTGIFSLNYLDNNSSVLTERSIVEYHGNSDYFNEMITFYSVNE